MVRGGEQSGKLMGCFFGRVGWYGLVAGGIIGFMRTA